MMASKEALEAYIERGKAKVREMLAANPRVSPSFEDLVSVCEHMLRHMFEDKPQEPAPVPEPSAVVGGEPLQGAGGSPTELGALTGSPQQGTEEGT